MVQDLPPTGGYGPVQYKRNLPFRGFRPGHYIIAMGAICTYGFYETMQGIKERRELQREKTWARIHLTPMLQAEADRDDVRRYYANLEREKELMKDVKGWEFGSVYHSDRFVRPTYTIAPTPKYTVSGAEYRKMIAAEQEAAKKE